MIKRTRLKFAAVMAIIIFIIIASFCTGILLSTYLRNARETDEILKKMINDFNIGGGVPDRPSDNSHDRFNNARGFSVKINAAFEIIEIRNNGPFFTDDEIKEYLNKIDENNKTKGSIANLEYRVEETAGGKIIAAIDKSVENLMFNELMATVLLAGGGGIVVLFIIIWFLSYWIVKPAALALEKQKRFISEAGHELKTPLTVVSAGVELLQKGGNHKDGEKWLKNIKEQIDKMSAMTSELLTLSRLEENIVKAPKTEFDLSQAVLTEALAFESIAFEQGKRFSLKIEEEIIYKGDFQSVCRAVAILCDNAVKYSDENGIIEVQLKKQAAKIIFSVSNSQNTLKIEEIPFLFERFYRGSETASEINGAGLGLAILKTLAENNGWKHFVSAAENKIVFSVIF